MRPELSFSPTIDVRRLNGMFAGAAALVLTIALGLLAARLAWLPVVGADQIMTSSSSTLAAARAPQTHDFMILRRQTPFKSSLGEEAPVGAAQTAPETELRLVLHGLRTGDEAEGVAVISGEGGAQRLYRTGDAIDGVSGVKLERVYGDGVLLIRNGRVERLPISPDEDGASIQTVDEFFAVDDAEDEQVEPAADVGEAPPPVKVGAARLTRAEVLLLFQTLRLEDAPDMDDGGVMVFPLDSAGPFRKSGLKSRDIIQTINNVPITESTDYRPLLEQIDAAGAAEIGLFRDNQYWRLTIKLTDE